MPVIGIICHQTKKQLLDGHDYVTEGTLTFEVQGCDFSNCTGHRDCAASVATAVIRFESREAQNEATASVKAIPWQSDVV